MFRYSEFVPLLYSKPTFILSNWSSMVMFFGSILPQRFNAITSIRVDAGWATVFESWICEHGLQPLTYHGGLHRKTSLDVKDFPLRNNILAYPIEDDPTIWRAVCNMLCKMIALKELNVELTRDSFGGNKVNDEAVIKPLIEVGQKLSLQTFDVRINWNVKEVNDWEAPEIVPFTLHRHPQRMRPWYVQYCFGSGAFDL